MADSRVRPEEEEASKEDQISDMKSEETRVKKKEKVTEKSSAPTKSIWDCGSPLYDSYELVSVTHVIERHWMIFPFQAASSSKNSSSHREKVRKSMSSSSKNTVMNKIMTMKTMSNRNKISTGEARNKNKAKTTTNHEDTLQVCKNGWDEVQLSGSRAPLHSFRRLGAPRGLIANSGNLVLARDSRKESEVLGININANNKGIIDDNGQKSPMIGTDPEVIIVNDSVGETHKENPMQSEEKGDPLIC
ncbi:hypothetical protein K1719_019165 [Acacia pycnantha]|nr:hypothetical protein K1719_019165 [Acacia pycnantha]